MIRKFIQRPQQVLLRKALFQVHLWVGLFLALYVVLIGLSGSILVFREELQELTGSTPRFPGVELAAPQIDISGVMQNIAKEFPGARQTFLYTPREEVPVYQGFILEGRKSSSVYVHPVTGKVLARVFYQENLLSWIGQLHYFLLLGRSPGLWLNGVGSALLLALCISGLVIWWPGIRAWRRGFVVDFSKSWKRINFDSHNVIGFWTLSLVSFWAISGVYFAWPREFTAFVNRLSPVSALPPGRITVPGTKGSPAPMSKIAAAAAQVLPGRYIKAVRLPATPKSPVMLYMTRDLHGTFSDADHLYFNPANAELVAKSIRGGPDGRWTAGDWIIWSMRPLHFGTEWGMAVKVIWFVLGLALPLLVITGVLMYWNRYLGKKWNQLRRRSEPSSSPTEKLAEMQTLHH